MQGLLGQQKSLEWEREKKMQGLFGQEISPAIKRVIAENVEEGANQEAGVRRSRSYLSKLQPLSTVQWLYSKATMSEKVPENVTVDPDNVIGVASESTVAAVNGEITLAAGGSVTLTYGGSSYRSGILRRFVAGGDANFGRLQVVSMSGTYLKAPYQGSACGLPLAAFSAQVVIPFRIDCPVDNANNLKVTIVNPTAGTVVFSMGAEID